MAPAYLYLGFAAYIIWVAEKGTVIGSFIGVLFGVFVSHQVIGNLLTFSLPSDGVGGSTSGTILRLLYEQRALWCMVGTDGASVSLGDLVEVRLQKHEMNFHQTTTKVERHALQKSQRAAKAVAESETNLLLLLEKLPLLLIRLLH